jgi:hypothetical protein
MVIGKVKFIFWILTILAIGFACGYLFSSKFCRVSINKRVQEISTLNQSLRKLFALRAFYNFENLQAQVFKIPNQETINAQMAMIRTNQEISNLIAKYYDRQAEHKINQWLDGKSSINEFTTLLSQLNPIWASSIAKINENLTSSQNVSTSIKEALSRKYWARAFELFEKSLDLELEFADELDRGITQQFPHKF